MLVSRIKLSLMDEFISLGAIVFQIGPQTGIPVKRTDVSESFAFTVKPRYNEAQEKLIPPL